MEKVKRVYEKAKPLGEIRLKKHRHLERSEACHSEGIQCPKKLRERVYLLERLPPQRVVQKK